MTTPLAFWRKYLAPTPLLADPRPSVLMNVAERVAEARNYVAAMNDPEQREVGLAVANMAVGFACELLDDCGLECLDGAMPPILNLRMAVIALDNLAATARGHYEAGLRAERQDDDTTQAVEIVRPQPEKAKLAIARWADIGIGIDDDWTYYGFTPCPADGANVTLRKGIILSLMGDRWKKVLPCFARSHNGKTVEADELILELGYRKAGNIAKEEAMFVEGLTSTTKTVGDRLRTTMADLGRELRDQVSTTDKKKQWKANGNFYQAAFTTRHLFRDDDGYVTFGRVD